MKNIEDFIHKNRADFDSEIPEKAIWLTIEKELDSQTKGRIVKFSIMKLAAVLLTFLCVGILIGLQFVPKKQLDFAKHEEFKKMMDIESHYSQQVSYQLQKIDNPEAKQSVEKDLKELDAIYQELKSEILKNNYANSQIIIEAMIKNQKTKTDILERILSKQSQIIQNESL